ncbi:hypothetical protein [Kaistella sp.]|uniref:hypothetical protein n=1 Tax=Kaistella sp. TaxID=2782235 RepID=UPI0035A1B1B1
MTTFLIILIALYTLYYVGNIIYDLFLKTQSTVKTNDNEIFSLAEFEEENRSEVKTVGIEDVENLTTPKSFYIKQFPIEIVKSEERQDIDDYRRRFESEQNIDSFDEKTWLEQPEKIIEEVEENLENEFEEELHNEEVNQLENIEEHLLKIEKASNNYWENVLNIATSSVQLVQNLNGHKVYHSTLNR